MLDPAGNQSDKSLWNWTLSDLTPGMKSEGPGAHTQNSNKTAESMAERAGDHGRSTHTEGKKNEGTKNVKEKIDELLREAKTEWCELEEDKITKADYLRAGKAKVEMSVKHTQTDRNSRFLGEKCIQTDSFLMGNIEGMGGNRGTVEVGIQTQIESVLCAESTEYHEKKCNLSAKGTQTETVEMTGRGVDIEKVRVQEEKICLSVQDTQTEAHGIWKEKVDLVEERIQTDNNGYQTKRLRDLTDNVTQTEDINDSEGKVKDTEADRIQSQAGKETSLVQSAAVPILSTQITPLEKQKSEFKAQVNDSPPTKFESGKEKINMLVQFDTQTDNGAIEVWYDALTSPNKGSPIHTSTVHMNKDTQTEGNEMQIEKSKALVKDTEIQTECDNDTQTDANEIQARKLKVTLKDTEVQTENIEPSGSEPNIPVKDTVLEDSGSHEKQLKLFSKDAQFDDIDGTRQTVALSVKETQTENLYTTIGKQDGLVKGTQTDDIAFCNGPWVRSESTEETRTSLPERLSTMVKDTQTELKLFESSATQTNQPETTYNPSQRYMKHCKSQAVQTVQTVETNKSTGIFAGEKDRDLKLKKTVGVQSDRACNSVKHCQTENNVTVCNTTQTDPLPTSANLTSRDAKLTQTQSVQTDNQLTSAHLMPRDAKQCQTQSVQTEEGGNFGSGGGIKNTNNIALQTETRSTSVKDCQTIVIPSVCRTISIQTTLSNGIETNTKRYKTQPVQTLQNAGNFGPGSTQDDKLLKCLQDGVAYSGHFAALAQNDTWPLTFPETYSSDWLLRPGLQDNQSITHHINIPMPVHYRRDRCAQYPAKVTIDRRHAVMRLHREDIIVIATAEGSSTYWSECIVKHEPTRGLPQSDPDWRLHLKARGIPISDRTVPGYYSYIAKMVSALNTHIKVHKCKNWSFAFPSEGM